MATTTLADIAACFRILLDREPSTDEVTNHARAHLGQDLTEVVKSYLMSNEFRARQLMTPDETPKASTRTPDRTAA